MEGSGAAGSAGASPGAQRALPAAPASAPRHRPLISAKDLLWLLYLYPLRFVATRLSAGSLYRLGRAIEPLFQLAARSRKREAVERMELAFGARLSRAEIESVAQRFVANAIRRALDDFHLADPRLAARLPPPELHGLEHVDAARAAGRGVLLVSGHFYANRLGKHHLARMGYPVLSVRHGRPPDGWMGRLGEAALQRRYIEFLHGVIRDEAFLRDPELTLKIFRRLRCGGLVNVHVDVAHSPRHELIELLGKPRRFATGLLEIVRLSGCAVIPMRCRGNQRAASITFGEPLAMTPCGSREEYARENLRRLVGELERQIVEHPDQWELWVRL
jgi:Kdo2-lipid IVA lauroyltransferase/acyltransferase